MALCNASAASTCSRDALRPSSRCRLPVGAPLCRDVEVVTNQSMATYRVLEEDLQGLVFDCDGTLIDTMPAYWASWKVTCRHFGLDFNQQRFYSMAGVPVADIIATLISEAKLSISVTEVCNYKYKIGSQSVAEVGIPPILVVVAIARAYYGKIPMAVASSGNRSHVLHSLRINNILDLFDAVVTCEDIANPKPAPDIFLLAAHKIGCDPTKCR
ncbi:HAD-like domain-containing protein, partial [Ochromonadaceae sp. CCMP2298]